jgi:signal transduction histidine kinase
MRSAKMPLSPVREIRSRSRAVWLAILIAVAASSPGVARTQQSFADPSSGRARNWIASRPIALATIVILGTQAILTVALLAAQRRRRHARLAEQEDREFEQGISVVAARLALHPSGDTSPIVRLALERLRTYTGAECCLIVEVPDDPEVSPVCIPYAWSGAAPATAPTEGDRLRLAALTIEQLRSGTPALTFGNGFLVVPLKLEDAPLLGSLVFFARDVRDWSPHRIEKLCAAADGLTGALAGIRAARAARESEELNTAVLDSISSEIAIVDRRGAIVRVNAAWRETTRAGGDATADFYVGGSYLAACQHAAQRGDVDAGRIGAGIEAVLDGRAKDFRYEYQSPGTPERWYEVIVAPIERVRGGAVVLHVDITNRHVAERFAEDRRREVVHMARVTTAGELVASIAHELRQPLTAIAVNAQAGLRYLCREEPALPDVRAVLNDIQADNQRAVDVIERLWSLVRREAPRGESVSLNDVCASVARLVRTDAALRHTRLELDLDPALPRVTGDPVQLQQMVLNLVMNGLDAAGENGEPREVVVRTATPTDGVVQLAVRDSGPGLSPDTKSHLFESFFSTKTHGLGMGLAIVRSIVDLHKGMVRGENDPHGGAVFRVTLPGQASSSLLKLGTLRPAPAPAVLSVANPA